MSRIKWARMLLLVLLLTALCIQPVMAQQDILSGDQLMEEEVNYETATVYIGDFEKTAGTAASPYYPLNYGVRFEEDNAKFVRYTVSRGDEVKAGDVLMEFYISGSSVEFTRMQMDLERLIETTEEGISSREEQLRIKRTELNGIEDPYEREKATLQLHRMEMELEQYKFQQQYSIDAQQEAVDEEEARRTTTQLLAPVDGIVTSVNFKQPDDAISNGETMVYMYSTDVMLLVLDNSIPNFRYNMSVTIEAGPPKNRISTTGRVVAADDSIDEADRTGKAYIQLDDYSVLAGLSSKQMANPSVTGSVVLVEDVTLVNREAVTMDNGNYFVIKLNDEGVVQKRYVNYGAGNVQSVWLMQGVEEGKTLVIDD